MPPSKGKKKKGDWQDKLIEKAEMLKKKHKKTSGLEQTFSVANELAALKINPEDEKIKEGFFGYVHKPHGVSSKSSDKGWYYPNTFRIDCEEFKTFELNEYRQRKFARCAQRLFNVLEGVIEDKYQKKVEFQSRLNKKLRGNVFTGG